MNRRTFSGWAAPAAALVLVGCGGGGAGEPAAGAFVREYGPVSATSTTASAPPVVWSGGRSTFAALYGANFTDVRVRFPAPSGGGVTDGQSNTLLAYTRNGQTRIHDLGSDTWWPLNPDPPELRRATWPSISGLGTRVATSEYDPLSGRDQVFMTNIDGTGRKRMTASTATQSLLPVFSLDGSRIYYISQDINTGQRRILSLPVAGGAATALTPPAFGIWRPCVSPDGKTIAYIVDAGAGVTVRTMKTDGTANTQVASIGSALSGNDLCWVGPSSSNLLCLIGGAAGKVLMKINLTTGNTVPLTGDMEWGYVAGSPLSDAYVYQSYQGVNPGLFRQTITDGTSNTVLAGEGFESPSWGPYIQSRTCVGAGGALGTNSSGVVIGLSDGSVRSVVSTVAATPGTVQVLPFLESGNGTMATYTIRGDEIRSLAYVNHLFGPMASVVTQGNPATYCNGALVTMSNETGKVVLVTTYVGTVAPKVSDGPGGLIITGKIKAAFDAAGRNLAPAGAASIALNPKAGAVPTVR